jgi:sugar lactone lactonase YvrE
MYRTVGLFVIITALGATACATHEDTGRADLTLTGTSASGITYRLRDAELTITGDIPPIVFFTEDDPDRTLITQQLDAGDYSLKLTPGWRLERLGVGGPQTVVATLLSPDPQPFTIVANTFTPVVLRFSTNGEVVVLDRGTLGITIDVEDQLASCAAILAANPMAPDGVYTISPAGTPIQVFCDMTRGGVTYEQLAFGNSFSSYEGYSLISTSELNDPVLQQAFTALFNQQGSAMINIDNTFISANCCIKAADSGPNSFLHLGGHIVFPASVDNSIQCLPQYPDPSYRFAFGDTFEVSPTPLPADFLSTHPATTAPICGDDNNPGWFFKRLGAAPAFTVGGTVSGLTATGLVLQNNGGDDLVIGSNGGFTFATPVASGATYAVTVKTSPSNQACVVTSGTGTIGAANVTDVVVTCGAGSLFPIAVPGTLFGFGDLALDNNNNLLVVSASERAIVRVSQLTGAQSTVATGIGVGGFLIGVAYRAANDTIYTNTDDGQIFAVTAAGAVTPLATVSFLNAIAIAPQGFGSFGGFVIGATQIGTLVAVNPFDGVVTTIATSFLSWSDLAFAPDGTLYACGDSVVSIVTATGQVTTFTNGLSSADGITIAPDGSRMFIADSNTDSVRQVTIPDAVESTFALADIDDGFFVGGLIIAPGNTLIVMTGEFDLTLVAFAF